MQRAPYKEKYKILKMNGPIDGLTESAKIIKNTKNQQNVEKHQYSPKAPKNQNPRHL